jgi:hypothetical protein
MGTRDLPHGAVGYAFARALLEGDYDRARAMLCEELKIEYSAEQLRIRFERMLSIADPVDFPDDVLVMDNSELDHASQDDKGWAYVPIWTEAITVTVRPFGQEHLITELIWGRP